METLNNLVGSINGIVWGPLMLVLILGTGLFLQFGLKFMPLRNLGYGFRQLWQGRRAEGDGDITPFNALMTSLSATIGTGNIAGVGTAIALGGPGALFWMWCTALVGMATKYAEAVLAVKYREVDEAGNHVGGPMYYIKNGLGSKWVWMGTAFAIFGMLAGFGIGNMVQANSVAHALETNFDDATTTPTGPEIRRLCIDAPSYGNDDPYVDDITKDCLNILVKELRHYRTRVGGRYQATISPVSAHVPYGMICGATPDGRKAGAPLSEGCSPAQGADVSGPTATVKSVANLEHINLAQGTIFNMRMHPGGLETRAGMRKWAQLVRTYFDLGGWEVQFNVVDADTLRAAQESPEEYRDLVVRVVGYSAFFVDLDKAVQDDIIARTEHNI